MEFINFWDSFFNPKPNFTKKERYLEIWENKGRKYLLVMLVLKLTSTHPSRTVGRRCIRVIPDHSVC